MGIRKLIDRIGKPIDRMGKTSRPFDAALQQFLSPDQGKIEDELRLAKRAEKDGKDNSPKSKTKKKDAIALDIDNLLNAILRKAKKELEDHLHGLSGLDIYQTTAAYANDIRGNTQTALTVLRQTCRNGVNSLFPQRRKVADGEFAIKKFKDENGLHRPAVYPKNINRTYGIIFFLFALEDALNAYTLGSAHPEGAVGVVLETFLIAALNIAVGFTAGWVFWRELGHKKISRKIIGLTGTAVLLFVTFAGNLAVGHYRDGILSTSTMATQLGLLEYIRAIATLGKIVVESLQTHTFELYDFKSYLTVSVGTALALYAAKEGFRSDDRYPGYGRISREQDERVEDYSSLFARLQSELTLIDKGATQDINSIGRLAESAQAASQDHVGTAERLISDFKAWTEEIRGLGAALYAKYREINEKHRTEPRPPSFEIDFSLPPALVKEASYPGSSIGESTTNIDTLVDQCSTKINFALNEYLGVYKTIGALAPEDVTKERASSFDVEVERIYRELSRDMDDRDPDDG